jgi:homogentisate 1,2-dioxygenase
MLDRMAAGELPKKPHTQLRGAEGELRYEQCLTRAGFDGPFSMLYHQSPPQDWVALEEAAVARQEPAPARESALLRRHYRTRALPAGSTFYAARSELLENPDILLSISKPTREDTTYYVNADADELWFVREGRGTLRSAFGDVTFGPNDYVCVPKGVLRRVLLEAPLDVLSIECRGGIGLPAQFRNAVGQLRMDAPYSHRDFRRPQFNGPCDEGVREIVVKRMGREHRYAARSSPLDAVGWDGTVYPWAFPILAFQPRVSSVHLPPTWHGTFAAQGALICSFVPRPLDFHPDAIPCPYPHASVDIDEVLYYVQGKFGSRTGVESGSITLHPRGVAHGPQPGRYEGSIGAKYTDELAVMLDCALPLQPCAGAREIEDLAYEKSFSGGG